MTTPLALAERVYSLLASLPVHREIGETEAYLLESLEADLKRAEETARKVAMVAWIYEEKGEGK